MVRLSDTLTLAWAQVRRRPGPAAGILVLSLLASALVLGSLANLSGSRKAAQDRLGSLGAHLVVLGPLPEAPLDPTLVDRIRAQPDVADALPELALRLPWDQGGEVEVLGIPPGPSPTLTATTLGPADLLEGRWPGDDESRAVLVTEGLARSGSLGPGSPLVLGGAPFEVAGVVQPGVKAVTAQVYLPLAALNALTGPGYNRIAVEARSALRLPAALEQIRNLAPEAEVRTFACSQAAVTVFGLQEEHWRAVNLVLWLTLGLSVLAATGAALHERRGDFALLRACGWVRRAITAQLAAEAAGPSLAGSAAGVAAGLLWNAGQASPLGPADLAWLVPLTTLGPALLTLAAALIAAALLGRRTVARLGTR